MSAQPSEARFVISVCGSSGAQRDIALAYGKSKVSYEEPGCIFANNALVGVE